MDNSLNDVLTLVLTQTSGTIAQFLPQLIAAIIVIIIGLFVSSWLKSLFVRILQTIKISKTLKDSPLGKVFDEEQSGAQIDNLLGEGIRWFFILLFVMTALNIVGLSQVSNYFAHILGFLPNVFAAAIVLVFGTFAAGLGETLVKNSFKGFGRPFARMLGKMVSYLILTFTLLAVFAELGIAEQLIYIIFIGIISALALGTGLAIGLGAKDLVAQLLSDWYKRHKSDLS